MTSLDILRDRARSAAALRGHDIAYTTPWHGEYCSRQSGSCVICKRAYVQLTTRPMPNEIEMGGDALALNCKGRKS